MSYPNTIVLDNGDNPALIQQAIDNLPENGTLRINSGNWILNNSIVVDKNINFIMEHGSLLLGDIPGVLVDFVGSSLVRKKISVNVERTADWTQGNTGVRIGYAIGCDISVNAMGFEKGLHIESVTGFTLSNKIFLGDLWHNKHAVYCNKNGGSGVSRNVFFGGRLSVDNTEFPAEERHGIHIDGGSGNVFYGCEITIQPGEAGLSYPIYIDDSNNNRIVDGTIEGGSKVMKALGTSNGNTITALCGSLDGVKLQKDAIIDESDWPGTNGLVDIGSYSVPKSGLNEVFESVDMVSMTNASSLQSPSKPKYIIPGHTFLSKSTGGFDIENSMVKLSENYIKIDSTYAIGREVDTSIVKSFSFQALVDGGIGMCIIVAFDEAGDRLATGVLGKSPSMSGSSNLTHWELFGGSFACSQFDHTFFYLSEDVEKIWIGYCPYDGNSRLSKISLKTPDTAPQSNAGYNLVEDGQYAIENNIVSNGAPKCGVFNNGTQIWNVSPQTGDTPLWVATNRQSTESTEIKIAGDTSIAVSDASGINDGDIVGLLVNNDTEKEWFWTTVSNVIGNTIMVSTPIQTGYTIQMGAKVITHKINALSALSSITIN